VAGADRPVTVSVIRRLTGTVWLLPAALMAVMGLWQIGRPELWQDELVTVDVARRSVHQILATLQHVDAVHGAYYLFMHFWMRLFGASPVAVRLPSAFAMVAAVICVVLVGERLFDRRTAILGGLVFDVVPSITRFAQETRSYAMVIFAAALSTLLLLRALERSTVQRWFMYGLCISAMSVLNTVAVTIVAGHLIGMIVLRWPRPSWRLVVAFGAAVGGGLAPAVPAIVVGMSQADRQLQWITHTAPWLVWPQIFASFWVSWAVLALAALAWFKWSRMLIFATVLAVAPPLLVWLASSGTLAYFFPKYLLFSLPAWAMLAGAGLAVLRPRLASVAGVALVAALAIPGQMAMRGTLSHSWYNYPSARTSDPLGYADVARFIAANYHAGDGVIYQRSPWWWEMVDVGVDYYLPSNVRPRDVFRSAPASSTNDLMATECPASILCVGNEPRIWLVAGSHTDQPLAQLSPDQYRALAPNYTQVSLTYEPGLTVALLERVH
jgi:mannosyltransferase